MEVQSQLYVELAQDNIVRIYTDDDNFHELKQSPFLLIVIYSVTPDSGPSQLSVVTDTTTTVSNARTWNMKVYQYECSSTVLGTQTISLFSRYLNLKLFSITLKQYSLSECY